MTNPAYVATNSDVEKLINSEIADFFAGFGHPGEPETPQEMQQQLQSRISAIFNAAPNGMMQLSNELAEMKRKCGASNAVTDVIAERQRQISAEGWTPEHDDEHDSGEMAGAAACYARYTNARGWIFKSNPDGYRSEYEPNDWPWSPDWWKPTNPRRDLVKAGALIIAEIERIDRAAGGTVEGSE